MVFKYIFAPTPYTMPLLRPRPKILIERFGRSLYRNAVTRKLVQRSDMAATNGPGPVLTAISGPPGHL